MMRLEQLTFTRFLAAISIVIFHYGRKSFLFDNENVAFVFRHANVFVSYFFILSGFVLIVAYGNKSFIAAVDFFRNRFARIYPIYFLAIVLTLFLQIRTNSIDLQGLFLNVFMLQAWIPGKLMMFNPPGWSLSVEFLFYAIFPFVFNRFFKKNDFKQTGIVVILFWIFSQIFIQTLFLVYPNSELVGMDGNPLMHLNEFLIGNLAGFYFIKKLKDKIKNYDFIILLLASLLFFVMKIPLNLNFNNGLLAFLFIPIIIFISLNNGLITKVFQKKPFVFLGQISYGIYILQYPIYSLFSAYSINKYFQISDSNIVFFIRLVILIVVSSITYIYIEKPIQEIIKTKKKTILKSQI